MPNPLIRGSKLMSEGTSDMEHSIVSLILTLELSIKPKYVFNLIAVPQFLSLAPKTLRAYHPKKYIKNLNML